jgi:hypothetical protein
MILTTITTYLNAIPPLVIVILAGLAYAYVAAGRWSAPMLLDGVLMALYLWRPSIGMLAFVLLLGSVRHVPAFARELAVMFQLDSFQGWTAHIVVFVLPALMAYTRAMDQHKDAADLPPMVDPMPAPPSPPIIPEAELPLLLPEGLKLLNNDPTAPHIGVIGATRLGKTTFVGVVLAYRASDLVIATPKAKQYDPWFDAAVARPVVLADEMSYAPIEQAVNTVYQEMLRRNAPGGSATPIITLVIDEWPQVVGELPSLAKKVINLLRMGAGCGIRLILMATDVNVRGWKMDGVAGVLDNLVFAKVEDGRKWSIGRIDPNWRLVSPRGLDTSQVWGLAERVSLAGRGWAGARVAAGVPVSGGDLLGGLLSGSVVVGGGVGGVGVPVSGAGMGGEAPDSGLQTHTHKQTNAQTEAEQRIALYRVWRAAGIKRDQARLIRQGLGDGLDDSEWAEAGKKETT